GDRVNGSTFTSLLLPSVKNRRHRTASRVIARHRRDRNTCFPPMRLLLCYSWLSIGPDWPDRTGRFPLQNGQFRSCFAEAVERLSQLPEMPEVPNIAESGSTPLHANQPLALAVSS